MSFLAIDFCDKLGPVVTIIYNVVNVLKWVVPILLILFGSLDLARAVIAGKEEEMKKAQGVLIRRAVYAIAVFLVFTLVSFIMAIIPTGLGDQTWGDCWGKDTSNVSTD